MKKLFYNRKLVITIFVVLIVLLTAVAIGPMVYSLLKGAGVKTEPVSADGAKAASTELDGTWEVAKGRANNHTLSLIHISEPTRLIIRSRMPSSA